MDKTGYDDEQEKMLEAQKKAEEMMEKRKKAQSADNKEFWEEKLQILNNNKLVFEGNLAETEFLLEKYSEKLKTFE